MKLAQPANEPGKKPLPLRMPMLMIVDACGGISMVSLIVLMTAASPRYLITPGVVGVNMITVGFMIARTGGLICAGFLISKIRTGSRRLRFKFRQSLGVPTGICFELGQTFLTAKPYDAALEKRGKLRLDLLLSHDGAEHVDRLL
ncbi:MAG: hypothetical protein DCC65_08365 [Planctomycetota bacterium]|nr:MAG: hypothetical protein DCC65_08365 [Planctomycetota bacterium]